jgi:hypothetical protein
MTQARLLTQDVMQQLREIARKRWPQFQPSMTYEQRIGVEGLYTENFHLFLWQGSELKYTVTSTLSYNDSLEQMGMIIQYEKGEDEWQKR